MKQGDARLNALEERIGYVFSNRQLFKLALTHSSVAGLSRADANNERLEFLGDRVLGLVIAEMLMEVFATAPEGELSRRLATLVRKETCAEVAAEVDLSAALLLGFSRTRNPSAITTSMLGDACEALIAALYLDGGLEAARRFIAEHWTGRMRAGAAQQPDPKSALQEWAQARRLKEPSYTIIERSGPQHDLRFLVEVSVGNLAPGRGAGRSRREAEQNAAAAVLNHEGIWKVAANGG